MLVIIGGSGMLLEASKTLVAQYRGPVLLCGRQVHRYQSILKELPHIQFFKFDFSEKSDYERLVRYIERHDTALTFLIWVHSPYYQYLAECLAAVRLKIKQVYLVKGSNEYPLPQAWLNWSQMTVIQLDKHPTEGRWLTHPEICQQVLQQIADSSQ